MPAGILLVKVKNSNKRYATKKTNSNRQLTLKKTKIGLSISYESSARQTIHMKCQASISLKNNKEKIKMSYAVVLISILRVKGCHGCMHT